MKTTGSALLALVFAGTLAGAFAGAKPAAAEISAGIHFGPSGAQVDLGFFYDDLAPYGSWVERPSYGWVWHPRISRTDWRPYQAGHWAWTDYGWTWISDEPFGWATYHYGRWYEDPEYGWEWVPGDEWGPSYVSWQEGDGYIGWAPLPPSIDIRAGLFDVALTAAAYLFVPEFRFLDARVYDYYVPRHDCERIFYRTRNWTSYRYDRGRVFAGGVPVDRVQRLTGHRVPRYQVADLGWDQRHHARFEGSNRVAMFRPQVERGRRVDPPSVRPLSRDSVRSSQGRWDRDREARQQQRVDQGRWSRQQTNDQRRWNDRQQVIDQQRGNRGQERQSNDQGRWNRGQERQPWQGRQQPNDQRRWNDRQQVTEQQRWNRGQERQSNDQGRWNRGQERQPWQGRQERQRQDGPRWQGRQQESRPQPQRMNESRRGGDSRGGRESHENRGGGGRGQSNDRGNRHGRDRG